MNIQQAVQQRFKEHRTRELARKKAAELERQARNVREGYAADLIRAWIARIYSLDLELSQMAVKEQDHREDGGIYELTIAFNGNWIETPRGFQVKFNSTFPVPCNYDAPERGQFTDFWNSICNGRLIKFNDLIDAIIYATNAKPDPISDDQLIELFVAGQDEA